MDLVNLQNLSCHLSNFPSSVGQKVNLGTMQILFLTPLHHHCHLGQGRGGEVPGQPKTCSSLSLTAGLYDLHRLLPEGWAGASPEIPLVLLWKIYHWVLLIVKAKRFIYFQA